MKGNPILGLEKEQMKQLKKDLPEFWVGDTVRVYFRIIEGNKERVQPFEGVVIKFSGAMHRRTFTVRRTTGGIGVERTFPLYSPRLEKIEVIRRGRVRRAKLYYLRQLSGKAARIKERWPKAKANEQK
ncbi:large subunit ribosomal protein L19 [Thermosulfidibacter takaii ABI70S6]|uniref:Large ribosomal subunit protein bL19 n=1 Tax=Thermosulfidibacter takaii (strain DSM 17441 / JCM 13301 / NBRC 103674 / ABI70S6) TaxID=1298851 RepID=A0A0S3QS97_THET7|nr:large subunit ribosomal protein L19 [Thermosulfidibacter takaii ABI70S6]